MTPLLMSAGRRAAGVLALACRLAAVVSVLPAHAAGVRGLAEPPEAVALVKRVAGHAELWREGVRQPLQEGQSLAATDRLQMGADGTAALVFRDGTRLTIGSSSELQLRRYAFVPKADGCDDCAFDVYLARGRAVYASGKIGKLAPQSVLLETPHGTAGVRGTRLILEVD